MILPMISRSQWRLDIWRAHPKLWRERCEEAWRNARTSEAASKFLLVNCVIQGTPVYTMPEEGNAA